MGVDRQFQLGQQAAERYEQFLGPLMAPFVQAVIEATAIQPGDDVLDVACGTGFVARAVLRSRPGVNSVVGCDLNPAMLDVASRAATAEQELSAEDAAPIEWRRGPADALPAENASFDVVVCQQGLQFVPDLGAALRAVARVLRPGGRFAATTWASLHHSPYMTAQYEALTAALGSDATESYPAAFSMGAAQLESAAIDAGLVDVSVIEITPSLRLPPLPGWAADHLTALPWGQALVGIGTDALDAVAADITARLGSQADTERSDGPDGSVELPFASLLLTARR